jgi:RNA polymerase sigma-70 factor (ECF subfamily)
MPQEIVSEQDLLKLLQDATTREVAFTRVVELYGKRLYWHIRQIVFNHEDANDILQNTFLKAWNALPEFRGEARIYTWLYRIAVFEALSTAKRNKRKLEQYFSVEENQNYVLETARGDAFFDGDDTEKRLQKAILRLPDKQKQVFLLRYYDNMPYEQISGLTGTSEGALKAAYHHAVKKIKEYVLQLN